METLRRVFEFVGVDPDFSHPHVGKSAIRPRARPGASRLAVRLERLSRTRGGPRPAEELLAGGRRALARRRPIERPDVRLALGPDVLQVLREDAERLRELTGRDFATWSIWDA